MKTVWTALLAKAERTLRDARLRLAEINRRRENSLLQEEKVSALLLDYNQQLQAVQQRDHNATEVNNYRHFIVQLQELKIRAKQEQNRIDIELQLARQVLVSAERERMKVDHLATRAKEQEQRESYSRETRSLDAQAIQQHNFRARIP
ncbi:flagellar FliJ family protein [SAR92 clade bacterium H455]|uniref:Flagellar FliJ protein n=1 Tax=SAR92 clade bacterium H455 TaxID=2974818 RepID=A0ABY5TMU2_9GAMM|nr:flagellar FliJ family protein [SAR92 clade bacterium H455]